ncbi:uncharacterized protein SPPG_06591 [Spizellomyces punctatus DAOM BR117]|uniref:PH domain-containing protein n=1 Tax=Spizellomyces punctatus (strain DAOM BR117) TaxID=645134 RepID=A0A0L0HBF4_SPIPD|nr:uncharacterized protein SPPG_06591 [Spizellomyces punctatus DAOM BR117]KNC98189.1 hypothetical protein SPPG_06591 [Spizellomyces punctatus DAOM BR117]|eukprot:XP_016606229.1 hypothetical protein SPPG_06591 [Spizellomyces punctatus DAOM BR117]
MKILPLRRQTPLPAMGPPGMATHASLPTARLESLMAKSGRKIPRDHLELWPYAREQCERLPIVLERFRGWKVIFNQLIRFFESIRKLETAYADEFSKFNDVLCAPDGAAMQEIFVFPSNLMQPVQNQIQDMAAAHKATATYIHERVIRRLKSLKQQVHEQRRHYQHTFGQLVRDVTTSRHDTIGILGKHDRTSRRTGTSSSAVSHTGPTVMAAEPILPPTKDNVDPWLIYLRIQAQLRKMIEGENIFQERILHFHREIAQIDAGIFDTLRQTIDQYLTTIGMQGSAAATHGSSLRSLLNNTDCFGPFARFSETFEVLTAPVFTTERKLEDFPYPLRAIRIEKQGILYRPGTVRKGHWKPVVAVLTESGWVHCFDTKLSRLTRRATSVGGVHIGSHHMHEDERIRSRATSETSSASQIPNSLLPLTSTPLPTPFKPFSINLASPRINIAPNERKLHQHVFTISMDRRKTGKLFRNSGSEVELKAASEEEMLDWISVLNRKIESYLPAGPPAPIFRSPQQLSAELVRRRTEEEVPGRLHDESAGDTALNFAGNMLGKTASAHHPHSGRRTEEALTGGRHDGSVGDTALNLAGDMLGRTASAHHPHSGRRTEEALTGGRHDESVGDTAVNLAGNMLGRTPSAHHPHSGRRTEEALTGGRHDGSIGDTALHVAGNMLENTAGAHHPLINSAVQAHSHGRIPTEESMHTPADVAVQVGEGVMHPEESIRTSVQPPLITSASPASMRPRNLPLPTPPKEWGVEADDQTPRAEMFRPLRAEAQAGALPAAVE